EPRTIRTGFIARSGTSAYKKPTFDREVSGSVENALCLSATKVAGIPQLFQLARVALSGRGRPSSTLIACSCSSVSDNFSQLVKQQADIVRIIGDYVRLRKSGAQNYTGLCPFHKEKTGSFSVNAAHGYFYCFGCHEKGDVFTFVMKMESIS